jgi:GNAT superfamily N-acetyltransferase
LTAQAPRRYSLDVTVELIDAPHARALVKRSSVELTDVPLANRALVNRFIRVPWHVNRHHHPSAHWVPPLLMDRRDFLTPAKNPFFDHVEAGFWLATRDGVDVGRIAAVLDQDYVKFHGEQTGYYGMFECIDDAEVAQALFERAESWLREHRCTSAIGPLELSTNYMSGVLIEGFDRDPGVQMPYNPPYYGALFEGAGFQKGRDLYFWSLDTSEDPPARIVRVADRVKQKARIEIRHMDLKRWDREVGICLDIYNDAWEQNWGFVPMSEKEFRHVAKDLKMVIKEDLGLIAEVDGEPVAFVLSIVDVNPTMKKIDGKLFPTGVFRLLWDLKFRERASVTGGRLILLGIRDGYRGRGIDVMLMLETYRAAQRHGLRRGDIGWTLEDNFRVNRAIEHMGGERVATYRVYEKALTAESDG